MSTVILPNFDVNIPFWGEHRHSVLYSCSLVFDRTEYHALCMSFHELRNICFDRTAHAIHHREVHALPPSIDCAKRAQLFSPSQTVRAENYSTHTSQARACACYTTQTTSMYTHIRESIQIPQHSPEHNATAVAA